MNIKLDIDKRISIYGSEKETNKAAYIITTNLPDIKELDEPEARLKLQDLIDEKGIKASVLFDGNGVWSHKRILRDIRRVKKNGMEKMTRYLYNFLTLCCGSIAHYNKYGWIDYYPDLSHFIEFFKRNEFGLRVLDDIPEWKTDCKRIVKDIEKELGITFPEN